MASAGGDDAAAVPTQRRARRRAQPAPDANPTLRQRELGRRLHDLRTGLGLTLEEVGTRLMCSPTKISRIETATRPASLRDIRDFCAEYKVTDQAAGELMDLARQAREAGWWTPYDDPFLTPLLGLEQEAVAITSFSMYHVPALLQSADYARAIIRGVERKIDPAVLGQRTEARLHRQRLLDNNPRLRFRALLDEAVLHRQVGGPAVLQAQLDKILDYAREDKAAVQVIPWDAGAHASTDSNFDFLEFDPASRQTPVIYVEGLFSNRYQERPAEIARYREAIEYLRDAALSPRDSLVLISKIRGLPVP